MKYNHHSRKIRQLNRLAGELKIALKNKGVSKSIVARLKLKITVLLHQLTGILSRRQLQGILGSLAIIFGLSVSNSVNAQIFAAPVQSPFGIVTDPSSPMITELADLDGDGDLDILSSGYYGAIEYFENTGTPNAPIFAAAVLNPFGLSPGNGFSFITEADLDGDGDFDVLIGEYYGNMQYFENTGSPTAPAFAAPVQNPFGLTGVYNLAFPSFVDIDGDSDMDLLVGEYYGNTQFFENTGTPTVPTFVAPTQNPFGITAVAEYAFPEPGDLDLDGDIDILSSEYYGDFMYFENTGAVNSPLFGAVQTNPFGLVAAGDYSFGSLGDMDGDGDLDIIAGANYGVVKYYENTSINVDLDELSIEASVSPNPFDDLININTNSKLTRVDIYSMTGQVVFSVDNPSSQLEVSGLEPGAYVVKLFNGKSVEKAFKLLKK